METLDAGGASPESVVGALADSVLVGHLASRAGSTAFVATVVVLVAGALDALADVEDRRLCGAV